MGDQLSDQDGNGDRYVVTLKGRLDRKMARGKSIALEYMTKPFPTGPNPERQRLHNRPMSEDQPHIFISHAQYILNEKRSSLLGMSATLVEGPVTYATVGAAIAHGIGLPGPPDRSGIASI